MQIRTTSGPVLERPGDPRRAADEPQGARGALHRRDSSHEPGDRGDPLSGVGGLRARHHDRAGPQRTFGQGTAAAVHADRRHDARRVAHLAAPRAVRDRAPSRLLRGGRAARDRHALGPHPERADRWKSGRRAGSARPGHAARREPPPAAGARLCRGPCGRCDRHPGGETGAGAARGGRQRLRRGGPAAAQGGHRQVRRRTGRAEQHCRGDQRGKGSDRRHLRAVSHPGWIHRPHAARPGRDRSCVWLFRPPGARPRLPGSGRPQRRDSCT